MDMKIKDLLYGREAAVIFIKQTSFNDDANESRLQSLQYKLKYLRLNSYLVLLAHKVGYLTINTRDIFNDKIAVEQYCRSDFFDVMTEIADEITETETYFLDRFNDLTIFDAFNDLFCLEIVSKVPHPSGVMGFMLLNALNKEHWKDTMKGNIEHKKRILRTKLMNVLCNIYNKRENIK